jgi:syndecan 1
VPAPTPVVPLIQRDALPPAGDFGVPPGVPVTAVRAGAANKPAPREPEPAPQAPQTSADLDDLARRLLDPMARLLRTEVRRGRERTGRPHDGRR